MEESDDDDDEMPQIEPIYPDKGLELLRLYPPAEPTKETEALHHGPPQLRKPLPSTLKQDRGEDQQTRSFRYRPTARELAAEALAADEGGWLMFDVNLKEEASLKYEAEKFVAKYQPSKVREVNGIPIHWICAEALRGKSTAENGSDTNTETEGRAVDLDGLYQAWEDLLQSRRPVTFQEIKTMAVAHRCLVGKWLVWKETGAHVDLTWERIVRATVTGQLGISAKVCSAMGKDSDRMHVICVYSENFADKSGVMELETRLRQQGIRCRLTYKPDAFTYLGIYRNNEWGLKPTIYTSVFDVKTNASVVTSVYE